jgi:hypothetical protein
MQFQVVVLSQYGGYAALGQISVGIRSFLFGNDGHRTGIRDLQREGEAGDAAADDQEIAGMSHLLLLLGVNY